ncbi:MAG: hypothetical protein MJZ76_03970 [Bacteroidales bacterium]|nr:hypothetical protein [Bacteroidales bacterium]
MKSKFSLWILALLCVCLFSSCRPKKIDGADTYCDSVMVLQNQVLTQVDSFFQSTRYVKYDTRIFYDKAVEVNERNILILKKLGGWKGDMTLNVASLDMLASLQEFLANEGKRMVELDSLLLLNYDHYLISQMDSVENVAIAKIQSQQQKFDEAQVEFLENFGFDVIYEDVEIDSTNKAK